MSDFGDALGTVAEGGLFARVLGGKTSAVVDKDGKPLDHGHFAEGACLNCGTQLQGNHCHECGQKAHLHRTLGAFMHDLLHGALHLDGKTWRTLPKLILKPGELTRRYIDGERAKFVSPMALFLFSIFLMFAVFQAIGLTAPSNLPSTDAEQVTKSIEAQEERVAAEIADLDEQLANEGLSAAQRAELEQAKARLDDQLAAITEVGGLPFLAGDKTQPQASADEDGDVIVPLGNEEGAAKMTIERADMAFFEGAMKKWRDNPSLMLYKLQANSYKFSWLLIPLSIPFVWLVFAWKRRFKAYDHAIFVTYSLAFMSLLFVTLSLVSAAGIAEGWIFSALAFIPPIHMYKQLRGTYQLSRFSALWRLAVLLVFIFIVLLLFLQLLLLLGAF